MKRARKPDRQGSSLAVDAAAIVQIKIWLLDVSPMVWRRVQVSADIMLRGLHGVIQVAMGWVQHKIMLAQVAAWSARHRDCDNCGQRRRIKGSYPLTYHTLFGPGVGTPRVRSDSTSIATAESPTGAPRTVKLRLPNADRIASIPTNAT
jgi:Plasmid pRiA4b ORF-3-like protein